MDFSIVIPTLNEEEYLPSLLADLAKQTNQSFEVIIVDGQSEDKTTAKAQGFKPKLPRLTIISSPKRGAANQRNLGGQKARGEYVIFMDADNRLPRYFLDGLRYRIHTSRVDIFTCWSRPDTNQNADKTIATLINLTIESTYLANSPGALGALIGCRRQVFKKEKGFDPEKIPFEDGEFVRRLHKKGYNCQIFHDPRFTYSLRRFRKNGRLKTLRQYALLKLKRILQIKYDQQKEYPMGGKVEKMDTGVADFYKTLELNLKSLAKKPKIAQKIRHLLQVIEDRQSLP